MNILVACEMSGRVREAFRSRGHNAWSCDLLPSMDGSEFHIQDDIMNVLNVFVGIDMLVAFPPCTHLASSGARWFKEKKEDGRQHAGIDFFMALANANIPRICIENPVGIMSSVWRKPDQIIQPWQFGHGETKATCLWLKNLPLLKPTNIVDGREAHIHKMTPTKDRAMLRSLTYLGVAEAMADQWGNL